MEYLYNNRRVDDGYSSSSSSSSSSRNSITNKSSNNDNIVDEEPEEYIESVDLFDVEKFPRNTSDDDNSDTFAKGRNVIAEEILHSLHSKDKIITQLSRELEEYRHKPNTNRIVYSWQNKYKRLERKCNNLAKQLVEAKSKHEKEREELEMELIEVKKTRAECDLEHQEVINKLNVEINKMKSHEQSQLAIIEREREYYKSEAEQLRMLLKIKESHNSNKLEHVSCISTKEKEESIGSAIDYNVSYEMMHNDLVAQENACVKLQSEVCALRSHVSQQLANIAELTLHNQEMENKLKHYKKVGKEWETEIERLTSEKDKLTEEIKALKKFKELQECEEEESECEEELWEEQQKQEDKNSVEELQYTKKCEQNEQKDNNAVECMHNAEGHIQDSHRIERLVLASEQKRADAEARVESLTNENDELQSELRTQRVCFRNEMLEQQTMCNALVKQWQNKLEESEHNLEEMTRQYEFVQNELHDLKRTYNDMCIELDNAEIKLNEMISLKNDVQDEVTELQESINEIESKLSDELSNSTALQRCVSELTTEQQHSRITLQHMSRALRESNAWTHSFHKSLQVALAPLQNLLLNKNTNLMSTLIAVNEEQSMQASRDKEEKDVLDSEVSSQESNDDGYCMRNSNIACSNNSDNDNSNKSSNKIETQYKETLKWIRKLVQHAKREIIDKQNKVAELKGKLSSLQASHKRNVMNEAQIMDGKMSKMHNEHVEEMAMLEKKYKKLSVQLTNYKKRIQQSVELERAAERKQMEVEHTQWAERQCAELRNYNISKCRLVAGNLLEFVKEAIDLIKFERTKVEMERKELVTNTNKMTEWQISDNIINECDEITQSILGLQGGWKELTSLIADQSAIHEVENENSNRTTTVAATFNKEECKMLHHSIEKTLCHMFDVDMENVNNTYDNKVTCVTDETSLANILTEFVKANIK